MNASGCAGDVEMLAGERQGQADAVVREADAEAGVVGEAELTGAVREAAERHEAEASVAVVERRGDARQGRVERVGVIRGDRVAADGEDQIDDHAAGSQGELKGMQGLYEQLPI